MENERVERELLEQCGQVVTLVECFGCNDATSALSGSKNFIVPSVSALPWTQTIHGGENRADAKLQLERRFIHIGEYASGNERSPVWREIDAMFESHILTGCDKF